MSTRSAGEKIALQICDFLGYLHSLTPPVVHRDITPDNIMIGDNGDITVLDFNVAQQLESQSTRTMVGKQSYIAPEQFRGKAVTQSDLYSVGATIFYISRTGRDWSPTA
jgi:serine/threonine protein kinase